ncbi:MAG TPA: hypothetical protein VMW83_02420 [Spirochaetia bacterium]|nr:hypothetical protein [Spirochaetia bacterium]
MMHDAPEEEIRQWLNSIAVIVLSDEFQALKKELETVYCRSNMDNARIMAFQDALYAFLAEREDECAEDLRKVF